MGHMSMYACKTIRLKAVKLTNAIWVILLNLVHIGNLQFLTIFYNLAANEHGFSFKISKI